MIRVWYVEDDPDDQRDITDALTKRGIAVTAYGRGEDLIKAIEADGVDVCEAVLMDWYLYEPNRRPRIQQPMQGGKIHEEVKRLKPYLPQFVVTVEDDLDKVVHTIISRHRFHGYFAKKWLNQDKEKVREFVDKIKIAVQEMKETLASLPNHPSWDKYKPAYRALRFGEPHEWERIEKRIDEKVEQLSTANFSAGNTLARRLPITQHGEVQIENVLVARRFIFSQIFFCEGRWHEVETYLGYEEKPMTYDNPYRIYSNAFQVYCLTLGFKPDEFRNSGEGLLAEEARWLQQYCRENNLTYGFPIA